MPENKNNPVSNGTGDYEAVYQNARQIIRQAWLDAGTTSEEYDAEEKCSERFRQQVEMRWAKGEDIEDLLSPNSEQRVGSIKT